MKKVLIIIFLVITTFCWVSYANDSIDTFSNKLYTETREGLDKYKLVQSFCDNTVFYNKDKFDAKESLFLNILCKHLWINTKYRYKSKTDLSLKEKNFKNIKSIFEKCKKNSWYITDEKSLNDIKFACVGSSIFNKLANDYLNIATYFAYWGFKWEDGFKKFEKDFFVWTDCDTSYLISDDDDKKRCQHPKTYKYIKELVSWLNDWLEQLYFIDVNPDNVYDKISWTDWSNHFLNVKDKLYNDLYFYTLFLEYYASMIELDPNSLSLKTDNMNWIENIKLLNIQEVNQARRDETLARYSVKRSFTVLKNIYRTFPLHIWYTALKEDISNFMKSLARVYTPIDQLRTKLENVQDKDKK